MINFRANVPSKKFTLDAPTFKVGHRVRISRKKFMFSNKYLRNWTTEISKISKIHLTDPISYSIWALDGEEILDKF